MKIVEILIKLIPFEDGKPSITCWVRTDAPYAEGKTEFACGLPFDEFEGHTPAETANKLRWIAGCIDTMSVRPRPKLTVVS